MTKTANTNATKIGIIIFHFHIVSGEWLLTIGQSGWSMLPYEKIILLINHKSSVYNIRIKYQPLCMHEANLQLAGIL